MIEVAPSCTVSLPSTWNSAIGPKHCAHSSPSQSEPRNQQSHVMPPWLLLQKHLPHANSHAAEGQLPAQMATGTRLIPSRQTQQVRAAPRAGASRASWPPQRPRRCAARPRRTPTRGTLRSWGACGTACPASAQARPRRRHLVLQVVKGWEVHRAPCWVLDSMTCMMCSSGTGMESLCQTQEMPCLWMKMPWMPQEESARCRDRHPCARAGCNGCADSAGGGEAWRGVPGRGSRTPAGA